ncbi:aerobic glycerol-3-phosphate dehydrogenase [Halalkalibacter akibai JCM 9157]|uniref:Aerobic glycerol-3-phosphate dehydrogenase n=1 Tax=Halalkalibacter akibai (strain ATCC 43226 / DSM 21942 / CIP 109018 / JCM 9157 / 1139) TaxID=1236973 RepID=W4QVQ3_HALA3|nr:aerobic glycerol-3-phosphate dehydrogenase [Halalkalibacter akibai JCM 9157]
MQDFAAGTSSRSTKLVHGGLRYLKQLEVKLVAEVGKERAIVYENAPHVTTPEWMLLPLIKGGTFGRFSLR